MPLSSTNLRNRGFTLVELLVSLSILALMVLALGKLLDNALNVTNHGNKRMDADSQARLVMDRLGIDIARIVKRRDVDYYFQKNTGNDQIAFFTESTGYYPTGVTGSTAKGNVSLISYRIDNQQLQRLSKALVWNGSSTNTPGITHLAATDLPMVFGLGTSPGRMLLDRYQTPGGGSSITTTGAASDPDYQMIGEQVYRLEYCYLMKDGTLSATPWLSPNTAINGLSDISGIIVAIAVLDPASRSILTDSDITAAAAALPDVAGDTLSASPLALWQPLIQSGDLGLPRAAAQQVRFYQRTFYLNLAQ